MAITVYFVRHGQTYLNLYNRIQGWSDAPLTPKGIEDAKRAGQTLNQIKFDAAFSSDASRAIITAQTILAANSSVLTEPIIAPAFREEFFGYFEGADGPHTWDFLGRPLGLDNFEAMIAGLSIEKVRDMIHDADPYGNAESNAAFWQRFDLGFDILRQQPDGATVLVVSHGTAIRSIVSRYAPEMNPTDSPKNGSITKLSLTSSATKIEFFNKLTLPADM